MRDILNWAGDHPILSFMLLYLLIQGVGNTIIHAIRAYRGGKS